MTTTRTICWVFGFVGVLACLSSDAKANNPFDYTWYDITVSEGSGIRYSGVSPYTIDPWFAQYSYTWELLQVEGHYLFTWMDLTSYVPEENRVGDHTLYDSPPADLMNETYNVEQSVPIFGTVTAQATVHAWVDADGYGRVEVRDVSMDIFDRIRVDLRLHIEASRLLGDANLNGLVDDDDLSLLLANWNTVTPATWSMGDFNYGTDVDDDDLSLLLAHWNWTDAGASATGIPAAIPEPAAMSLLSVGALALLKRRCR